jgi:hypothetical protein
MYKLIKNIKGEVFGAYKEENGFRISFPFSPDNTDYQAYLKWLAEGNVPLAAETNTPTPADGE